MQHIIPSAPTLNSLDLESIELAIMEHFARKNEKAVSEGRRVRKADQEKMITGMMGIVSNVIAPQIEEAFRLDLSDRLIGEELGFAPRRSKQLRLELKDAGVVWFPEWSRQKKAGDYPYWMLTYSFIIFRNVEKKAKTAKTSKTYNQRYCDLYEAACKAAYAELVEYQAVVTIRQFMANVYRILNDHLDANGITKESLKK